MAAQEGKYHITIYPPNGADTQHYYPDEVVLGYQGVYFTYRDEEYKLVNMPLKITKKVVEPTDA